MHHRLLVLQAVKLLVLTTDNDSDNMMNKRLQSKTYWLSLSPFDSTPKRMMTVKSVVELLNFKTRHAISKGCTPSLMTRTVLGLNSMQMKSNK